MTKTLDLHIGTTAVKITNPDKILYPQPSITKADVIQYYVDAAPYALSHWHQRPLTLTRYPHGIEQKGFYQKNCPVYAPDWIQTFAMTVKDKEINYLLCNDLATLVWLANQATIEIHPANFQITAPDNPSYAVIDLDPVPPSGFSQAAAIALKTKVILEELGLAGYPKTSGATGIHIYIPLIPRYSFEQVVRLAEFIGQLLIKFYPQEVTSERLIKNRRGVYIDHLQNQAHRTMAGVYSLRPLPGAPVSTPVMWDELAAITPDQFNLQTLPQRLETKGDLFSQVIAKPQSLDHVLPLL